MQHITTCEEDNRYSNAASCPRGKWFSDGLRAKGGRGAAPGSLGASATTSTTLAILLGRSVFSGQTLIRPRSLAHRCPIPPVSFSPATRSGHRRASSARPARNRPAGQRTERLQVAYDPYRVRESSHYYGHSSSGSLRFLRQLQLRRISTACPINRQGECQRSWPGSAQAVLNLRGAFQRLERARTEDQRRRGRL